MIADRGSIDSARVAAALKGKLLSGGKAMPKQLPVGKICAVVQRNTGKVFKTRGDEIVIIAYSADAGVRIESADNRVVILKHTACSFRLHGTG